MESALPQTQLYFDQEIKLEELLKVVDLEHLQQVLGSLLGPQWWLLDPAGKTILGAPNTPPNDAERAAFKLELEPVGFLESACREGLGPAVMLMEILVQATARYFMAAAVQMESVQQDFLELQDKTAKLQESERRYRELAADLEVRVVKQVQTIEAAQRQLYQTEKLASVGRLAAGVAHEINNPLGFIKSNLNTAGTYVETLARFGALMRSGRDASVLRVAWQRDSLDPLLDDFAVLLRESNDGVERVAKIVSALKDFSRIDHTGETMIDVNALLQDTCAVAASEFGERIRLITDYRPLPALRGDAGRLGQVFMNLLLNAIQAIPVSGEVRISTVSDGGTVRVAIADTGCGIAEDKQSRIFDPFFTTREVGQGTGLGLTVARDVVRGHGGHIKVESKVGVGTTVTVLLPVVAHG